MLVMMVAMSCAEGVGGTRRYLLRHIHTLLRAFEFALGGLPGEKNKKECAPSICTVSTHEARGEALDREDQLLGFW